MLRDVVGEFGSSTQKECIPWYFGFVLAAATNPTPGACCIVLNKSSGTTAIAAILLGLVHFQYEFPDLVRRYAKNALKPGQRVKVNPNGLVYEYEGVWAEYPNFFKLKCLGENTSRSVQLTDLIRLEPTDRVRPKGKGGSDLGSVERGHLDVLLNIDTFGNNSVIQNFVLLQMPRNHFAGIADAITLSIPNAQCFDQLSHFFPWGFIDHDGVLRPNDKFQVIGEPLIATTSVPEDLALASSLADVSTKAVLVDGARALARTPQAFDDIAERQRLVVLASPDEHEHINVLKDRGCTVWHMSADEILIGEKSDDRRKRASLVGATIQAARMRRKFRVQRVDCHDELLQEIATCLESISKIIADKEEKLEVDTILSRLFRILFECSECCFGVSDSTINSLRDAQIYVEQCSKWLEPAIHAKIRDAIAGLNYAVDNSCGTEKADQLLNILAQGDGHWAVATRSPQTAERLHQDLSDLHEDLLVQTISAFNYDQAFDGIIVPSWPNDQRFSRLRNLSVTPTIHILAYCFERKWVLRHEERERNRSYSSRPSSEELSSILNIDSRFFPLFTSVEPQPSEPMEEFKYPIFKLYDRIVRHHAAQVVPPASTGEDSRDARLVQFVGGCYAFLTRWAELPVLNNLIYNMKEPDAKLDYATASNLSVGDFVLFRSGGDKEFVRLVAEDILGIEKYQQTRDIAEMWKTSLNKIGSNVSEIRNRLAVHGVKRTPQTITGWLGNPDRIGPSDFRDIEGIARAAQDTELLSNKDEVSEAITRIRAAHLAAGTQLTNLILNEIRGRRFLLNDWPSQLDIDYGDAWVVQVEFVESEHQRCPASHVNRLMWVTDNAF